MTRFNRNSRKRYIGGGITHSNATRRENSGQRLRAFTARVDAGIYNREQENRIRDLAHRRIENSRFNRQTRNVIQTRRHRRIN
jgi:hypothetical protein